MPSSTPVTSVLAARAPAVARPWRCPRPPPATASAVPGPACRRRRGPRCRPRRTAFACRPRRRAGSGRAGRAGSRPPSRRGTRRATRCRRRARPRWRWRAAPPRLRGGRAGQGGAVPRGDPPRAPRRAVLWSSARRTDRSTLRRNAGRSQCRTGGPSAAAVASSAGRNASIASSSTVTSPGVPNSVVVERNASSRPSGARSRSGTTGAACAAAGVGRAARGRRAARRAAPAAAGSPVAATWWRSRASRCARHEPSVRIRGARPSGCRHSRSTLQGGSSSAGAQPAVSRRRRRWRRPAPSAGRRPAPGRARRRRGCARRRRPRRPSAGRSRPRSG